MSLKATLHPAQIVPPPASSCIPHAAGSVGAIRRAVELGRRMELVLVAAPYAIAVLLPVALVSTGWLVLIWGAALSLLLSIGAAQMHAWLAGEMSDWIRPRLMRRAQVMLQARLTELGGRDALVHSWIENAPGAVALLADRLLLADSASHFETCAIALADIARIQFLRGTQPNLIVVQHLDEDRVYRRHYLVFPDPRTAEVWALQLQSRLPAAQGR